MAVVDVQKFLNEDLPALIAQNAAAARQVNGTIQLNVTGEGGGAWVINAADKVPSVSKGNSGGADCTVTITVEDLQKLLENPQANGMALFFAGKLKVTGNPALVTKLPTLFTRT